MSRVDQRQIETEPIHRRRDDDDSPSGGFRTFKSRFINWMLGTLGVVILAGAAMVLKHESDLAVLKQSAADQHEDMREMKRDLRDLMQHFGLGKQP